MIDLQKQFVPHKSDPLLSLREAGRLIGRSHSCIRKWIQKGKLTAVGSKEVHPRVRMSELLNVAGDK